jgi:putative ABC transport system permease protein
LTYGRLIIRNLFRHPLRSLFTTLSIALSIFLVCAVLSLPSALTAILDKATSNTRISVHHEAGLTYLLPASYVNKVRSVPGVVAVNHFTWFGGIYDEPKNMFPNFGVDPDTVAEMWPDYHIDPAALRRFRAIRNAALVGEQTMRKFGWKVGQNVTLKGSAFPIDLTFQIVGEIPAASGNPVVMWFHHKYLEESLQPRPGWPFSGFPFVGMVWVQADRSENVERIMRDIDALFHNSEAETAAETERSFFQNFMSSFQGFIRVILGVGFLVVAAVVLIAANTSAMGVRERIPEIAVLKSLGFRRRPILAVLLCESMLQGLVGGILGAGGAYGLFRALAAAGKTGGLGPLLGPLGSFYMSGETAMQGVAIALAVGAIAGIVPAWNGARLNVIEALRKLF